MSPLRIYRVVLPASKRAILPAARGADQSAWDQGRDDSPCAALELVYQAEGPLEGLVADEYRGGTPGQPAGGHRWWGLLHRTHHVHGSLRHDPWAWAIERRADTCDAYVVCLTEVHVEGRSPQSNLVDPCSILTADADYETRDPTRGDSHRPAKSSTTSGRLLVTTAESRTGWFEPQPFVTGVYELTVGGASSSGTTCKAPTA